MEHYITMCFLWRYIERDNVGSIYNTEVNTVYEVERFCGKKREIYFYC